MTIERAVVNGMIASTVVTKTVFTAQVTRTPGEEINEVWDPYIGSTLGPLMQIVSPVWAATTYDVYTRVGDQWELIDTVTFNMAGTSSGDQLANAVACVLIGKCQGIRKFGRKFVSPLTESVVAGNALVSAGMVAAAEGLLAYITPVTTLLSSVLIPGVVSHNGDFHPFVGGVVSSLLGSIRRRKPGYGI